MESYSELYISDIVNSTVQKIYYENYNINFFKNYNSFVIPLKDVNAAVKKSGVVVQILYHEYKQGDVQTAYQPFLDWVVPLYNRYYSGDMDFETFLKNAGVYPLHVSIYANYKNMGKCQRYEDMIPVETDYEHKMFIKGLIGIFNYVSEKIPLLIVLNKLHLAELSPLQILQSMLSENPNNKIAIIAGYDEVYTTPDYVKSVWNSILAMLESKNTLSDWNMDSKDESYDVSTNFVPKMEGMGEYVRRIENMVESCAMEQAVYFCGIIDEALSDKDFFVSDDIKLKFYQSYAKAHFYNGNYSAALALCDVIRELLQTTENPIDWFQHNSLIALCHSCMGQDKLAEKAAKTAMEGTDNTSDEFLKFRAKQLNCLVMFRCWTNVYLWGVEYDVDDAFLADVEKYGYYNHLAYIHIFCFANSKEYYSEDPSFCESQPHYQIGMHYADMLQNDAIRLRALKKNVVFSSSFGYYQAVDHFYKKSLEILDRQDNKIEKGNVYNGLGYNRIVSEEFELADEYFNSALEIWYSMGKPENIGETLYNMSVNAILARDYQVGCDLLVTAVRIMKNLNQNKLELCNMSKIYGMIVLCYYKIGIEYNAQLYLNRMQLIIYHLIFPDGEPKYFMWDDDLFFYYFDKGLLARNDSLAEAQDNFNKAYFHLKRTEGLWFFAYEMFATEQADLYRAQGRYKDASDILEACLAHCEKAGYTHKVERLNAAIRGIPYEEVSHDLGLKKVTMAQIVELSKRVGSEMQLESKNNSLNFLTSWQEMMNQENIDTKRLIKSAMETLQNNYNADKIMYIDMVDDYPNLVYSDKDTNYSIDMLQSIARYFSKYPNEFMVNRLEKTFYDHKDIIQLFGINNIVSMIGVPVMEDGKLKNILIAYIEMHDNFTNNFSLFNEGDLIIFSVAYHQLVDAVSRLGAQERIRDMNAQLARNAVTDGLTGLYNRQGFVKAMDEAVKKYGEIADISTTILYIDLDNFKFYNDTFGHDIGDLLLVSFSNIFKEITKDRGYAIRYGGDEFVIVIVDSSEDEGVSIAKSIYSLLDETDGFADKLRGKMGKDFKIDPKNRVSCSIGIATADKFSPDSVNDAMKKADDALYVVKKTTKHNYKVWSPEISQREQ